MFIEEFGVVFDHQTRPWATWPAKKIWPDKCASQARVKIFNLKFKKESTWPDHVPSQAQIEKSNPVIFFLTWAKPRTRPNQRDDHEFMICQLFFFLNDYLSSCSAYGFHMQNSAALNGIHDPQLEQSILLVSSSTVRRHNLQVQQYCYRSGHVRQIFLLVWLVGLHCVIYIRAHTDIGVFFSPTAISPLYFGASNAVHSNWAMRGLET